MIGRLAYHGLFLALATAVHYVVIAPTLGPRAAEAAEPPAAEPAPTSPSAPPSAPRPAPAAAPRFMEKERYALAAFPAAPEIALAVPQDPADYRDLESYFGLSAIAYSASGRFIAAFEAASGEAHIVLDHARFLGGYAPRPMLERGHAVSDLVRRAVRRSFGRQDDLAVALVASPETARCFERAVLEACRDAGLAPAAVSTAVLAFERGPDGAWIERVIELERLDGHRIPLAVLPGGRP
jgi:hypothetical protein